MCRSRTAPQTSMRAGGGTKSTLPAEGTSSCTSCSMAPSCRVAPVHSRHDALICTAHAHCICTHVHCTACISTLHCIFTECSLHGRHCMELGRHCILAPHTCSNCPMACAGTGLRLRDVRNRGRARRLRHGRPRRRRSHRYRRLQQDRARATPPPHHPYRTAFPQTTCTCAYMSCHHALACTPHLSTHAVYTQCRHTQGWPPHSRFTSRTCIGIQIAQLVHHRGWGWGRPC